MLPEWIAAFGAQLIAASHAHPGAMGAAALVALVLALVAAGSPRRSPRNHALAGLACLALGLALLLMLGNAFRIESTLAIVAAWAGTLILPFTIRRDGPGGGMRAVWWLVSAGCATSWAVGLFCDPLALAGVLFAAGALGTLIALLWPAPPAPPAPARQVTIDPVRLDERLESDAAREAADKYTRE